MKAKKAKIVDERIRKSREKIISAACELLFEQGLAGASVDEISRRSGVAKTTIYRQWPTRTQLMRDACLRIGTPIAAPDSGDTIRDINVFLKQLARALKKERWSSVLPSVIDAAEREPAVATMYAKLQESYSSPLKQLIRNGIKKGELSRSTNAPLLASALIGPLFFRRWFSREPLTNAFVDQIVQTVLMQTANRPTRDTLGVSNAESVRKNFGG